MLSEEDVFVLENISQLFVIVTDEDRGMYFWVGLSSGGKGFAGERSMLAKKRFFANLLFFRGFGGLAEAFPINRLHASRDCCSAIRALAFPTKRQRSQ